ncbi:MAG: DUF2339 domain-containing protein [Bradymonadaceae bacterium]|nr:DUF2339 domain-containing protein [Lujinxingiaceae bacterium]
MDELVIGIVALFFAGLALVFPLLVVALWVKVGALLKRVQVLEEDIVALNRQQPLGARVEPAFQPEKAIVAVRAEAQVVQAAAQVVAPEAQVVVPEAQVVIASPIEAPTGASRHLPFPAGGEEQATGASRHLPTRGEGKSAPIVARLQDNLLAIIGILVIFVGIAAFLRYGASEGWFSFPIELRLSGIGVAAIGALGFGWWQREKRREFGLTLQGGAIGVLLMTLFAAFKFYELVPATVALYMAVVLVAACGVLAVTQNSGGLAVLAILAGFASPLLMSTGSGNHVALFSYYGVLNLAILAMAWWRTWPWLNLLGFIFTFGVGIFWGVLGFSPDKLWSTLPFLVLFFALYMAIPFLNARLARGGERKAMGFIDACLVFGNPIMTYVALTMMLMEKMPLAYAAFGIAMVNAIVAAVFMARAPYSSLGRAHAWIAFVFASFAVPLAFSERVTVGVFALAGLAITWSGLRSGQVLQRAAGYLLFFLATIFFLVADASTATTAVANANFMSGLILALTALGAAALYQHHKDHDSAGLFFVWGMGWWVGIGVYEIVKFVANTHQIDAVLVFLGATIALLALAYRFMAAGLVAWTMALGFIAVFALGIVQIVEQGDVFVGHGLFAWMVFAALGLLGLFSLKRSPGWAPAWAHSFWLFSWAMVLSAWLVERAVAFELGEGWVFASALAPTLALVVAILFLPRVVGFPLTAAFDKWRPHTMFTALVALCALWLVGLFVAGDAAPLVWIPLLNPLELMLIGALAIVMVWTRCELVHKNLKSLGASLGAIMMFVTVSNITLRNVHHLADVAWPAQLWGSPVAQTSLTIVWSLLGVLYWVLGSKRANRGVWLVGAILMGLALVKLMLIDRSHLGDLMGIGSFMGYGLLCLVVGYLAPVPPSRTPEQQAPDSDEATP